MWVVVFLLVLVVLVLPWVIRVLDAFTGLLGAWLSAVFLIPKVSHLGHKYKFFTTNIQSLLQSSSGFVSRHNFGGYVGFTSSQVLAGAKLASATIEGLNLQTALIVMD
jgi:SSS family solute:Na+ symporter